MKIQVNLPERPGKLATTVSVEVRETEYGPRIYLIGLSGEELDDFAVANWFDHDDSLEDCLTHVCPDCDQSHCEDGNCSQIDKARLESKIEEVKHAFHEMENIIDRG